MASIKISNAHGNRDELLSRLLGIKSKKKWDVECIKNIQNNNWLEVFKNLIYRIEYYSVLKVLNYTKRDLIAISTKTAQAPKVIEELAQAFVVKTITKQQQTPQPSQVILSPKDSFETPEEEVISNALAFEEEAQYVADVIDALGITFNEAIEAGQLPRIMDFYNQGCYEIGMGPEDFPAELKDEYLQKLSEKYSSELDTLDFESLEVLTIIDEVVDFGLETLTERGEWSINFAAQYVEGENFEQKIEELIEESDINLLTAPALTALKMHIVERASERILSNF